MLGVPRESEPDILRLTNELFASDDPDLQREGEDRRQATMAMAMEFYQLFDGIIQDRRAKPTDDLASLLANAQIDGEPMPMMEEAPPEPEFQFYTIVSGDTLWKIASKYYGNGAKWETLFEANRDVIDDPSTVRPGTVLRIPST